MSTENVEVQWLASDHTQTYMAKGHVDKAAMIAAVEKDLGEPATGYAEPEHAWWRATPRDGGTWYLEAAPESRGAFRCTVMVKDW